MEKEKMIWEIEKIIFELEDREYGRREMLKKLTSTINRYNKKVNFVSDMDELNNFSETSLHIVLGKARRMYGGKVIVNSQKKI